jgi:hypothetical protein
MEQDQEVQALQMKEILVEGTPGEDQIALDWQTLTLEDES